MISGHSFGYNNPEGNTNEIEWKDDWYERAKAVLGQEGVNLALNCAI